MARTTDIRFVDGTYYALVPTSRAVKAGLWDARECCPVDNPAVRDSEVVDIFDHDDKLEISGPHANVVNALKRMGLTPPNPRVLAAKLKRELDDLAAIHAPQFGCSKLERIMQDVEDVLEKAVDAKLIDVAVRALNLLDTLSGEDPAGTWGDAVEYVEDRRGMRS